MPAGRRAVKPNLVVIHKDGVDELYDLERDPYELTNVLGDPAYAAIVRELRRQLRALVAQAVGL